jgi:aminoglycoside/choline kinase family phosphotransferase
VATIPRAEDVTPEWLTERLHAAGHDAVVRAVRATRIGTGQIGKCIRFDLDLERADAKTPTSLVGKFPSDDPLSRATGVQLRNFIKEVSFYRTLQSSLRIRTPRCYYADIDGEGPDFALLLEDLRPATQGDQLAGCTPDVARAAVLELVGLHAPRWCDASLRGVGWLGESGEAGAEAFCGIYRQLLGPFFDRYGARLQPDERAIIEAVGDAPHGPLFSPTREPFSLIHVDYRLDNLLFDRRFDPPRVAVVDWQSITLGPPLNDVAYFLGAGLLPEARRPVEAAIVREYHAALRAAGVAGYDWARCWNDYRRGTFAGFGVTVIASMMVQQTERGDEMFTAMARRHAQHALDLAAAEFLD